MKINGYEIPKAKEEFEQEIRYELADACSFSYRFPSCEFRVYIDTDGEVSNEEWPADCDMETIQQITEDADWIDDEHKQQIYDAIVQCREEN